MAKIYAPASKKQEMFLNSDATITIAGGAAGSGKALRHGEKVHSPEGWINIEDCQVGMTISSPNGTTQKVTGVYPQGEVDIYRVTFQDGSFVDTCGDHLWLYHEARGNGKKKVSSTLFLKRRLELGFRPIVPLTKPVAFETNEQLPVKPYTLGVLLGDGSVSTNSVSFTSQDAEIVDNVQLDGYSIKQWSVDQKRANQYGIHGIQQPLRELGLLGRTSVDKFIPENYKNASVKDKISLVQGLMDTDGYVAVGGGTEYCTVSRQLALDMSDILRSLGFTVTVSEKQTYFTYKGKKKRGLLAYNLYIRGNNQKILFKLGRKLERVVDKKVGNRIVSIEHIGRDFATCISVSGNDKLFITSNYIVTHNTYTSLLIALKFMQHPRATGVIFRRVSKMLTAPGSIWHEAVAMYSEIYPKGLTIRNRDLEIVFPNGALLKFSHMQHESNMYDHKGGQYSLVIFDEGTDFTEPMVEYLLSRMRNAYVDYTPQMFIMTNPDYNSFLRLWIQDYYLDSEGIPIEERAGHKRYFYKQGDKKFWANSEQELKDLYGNVPIMSLAFIGARCIDNPPLMKADPTYKDRLLSLPEIEVKRLYWGSWFARAAASGSWKREWCNKVHLPNIRAKKRVRAYDIAGSLPSPAYPDPDWTRGVLVSKEDSGLYTVEDMVSLRDRFQKVEQLIFDTAFKDGQGVTIVLPCDPNAQAGAWAKGMQRRLGDMGFNCKLVRPSKSKAMRFAPFSTISQAGFVEVVEKEWYQDFCTELENFDMNSTKQKDDIVDAVSDCIFALNQALQLPSFSLPTDISVATPSSQQFGFQEINIPMSMGLPSN